MRYFWIALGIATVHRLAVFGIALLSFGLAMSAFSGNSAASVSLPLFALVGLLDFPSTIYGNVIYAVSQRQLPLADGALGFAAASFATPFAVRILVSLSIGAFVSFLIYRRDIRTGRRKSTYWKTGL